MNRVSKMAIPVFVLGGLLLDQEAKKLANIPGVQHFECLKQVSTKNKFEFGLSMEFASRELYEKYTAHPDHINFVKNYWLNNVEDFLEIDYEPMSNKLY